MAGEVALEAAAGFPLGLAFGDASGEICLGSGVVLGTDHDDLVKGPVELTVTAAAEPEPRLILPGGGFDRCDPAEASERGFAAESTAVGLRDDDLRREDDADAGFVEELRTGGVHEGPHGFLEVSGFVGERLDALSE